MGNPVIAVGSTKESARGAIEALGPSDPISNLQGNTVSTTVPAPGEVLTWNGASWSPAPGAGSGDYTVLSLAYDPTVVASGNGVFKTFNELYTAYSTSKGPVDLFFAQGFQPDPGTYSFRTGTRIRGPFNLYDPPVQITLFTGTTFTDVLWMDSIAIKSEGTPGGTLTWTSPYPSVRLENSAQILGNSPTPMVSWTIPVSAGFLNMDLQTNAAIKNLGPGPVIDLQGTGPGPDMAGLGLRLGQKCLVSDNAFSSNADATVNPEFVDGTSSLSFNQPNYLGLNSPLDPNEVGSIEYRVGLTVQRSFGIAAGNGAPPLLGIVRTTTTTDNTPTLIFPIQTPPPVISAGLDLRILAREASTNDSAYWRLKGLVIFGATATFGPLGPVVDFYDASPGAASWSYNIVLNTPDPGNIAFYVIGENGKVIEWSLTILEGLVLAF